jgi:hypothetical protein
MTQLLGILRESIKAVPAMKYALAVAGILAVVAMVGAFKISPAMAVFGAVITLVLMVAMVIFARLTTTAPRHFFFPVTIMMWAFLVITVATAFLLFTSAFFQWPRGLRELIGPPVAAVPVVAPPDDTGPLVAAARTQRENRDYAGAWSTISRALASAPSSKPAREEQTQIAMAWIRDMRVTAPATFAGTVKPLSEHLHVASATAAGTLGADIRAHIGFANFLRSREGERDLKIEEEYVAAVALDPANPFAQVMWGHWLAVQHRPLEELKERFRLALTSGRERAFVQRMRLAALKWHGTPEADLERVRVADEMRRNQEPLDLGSRLDIVRIAYSRMSANAETKLLAALPAADHLATFRWLIEGHDASRSPIETYYLARLTEAAGDCKGAGALYRPLLALKASFHEKIEAGLARCGMSHAVKHPVLTAAADAPARAAGSRPPAPPRARSSADRAGASDS